jgi:signal transduction histidine kinase
MIRDIKRHTFQHGAMSIVLLGEELIGHPSTAINELVKNGYDADANICRVYLHYDDDTDKSFAIIFDDGGGMEHDTLFGDWLQPSVSRKRKPGARSEVFKRYFLGSKGIGRLAAMALGRYTTVVTRTENEPSYNWLTVDREAFKGDRLLSEIEFPGDRIERVGDLFSDSIFARIRDISSNQTLVQVLENNSLCSFSNGTLVVIESLDESVITMLEEDFRKQTELLGHGISTTDIYKSLATLITPLSLSSMIQKELLEHGIIQQEVKLSEKEGAFSILFGTNLLPEQKVNNIDWQKIEAIPVLSVYDYRVLGRVKRDGSVDGYFYYRRLENDAREEKLEISEEEVRENSLSDRVQEEPPSAPVGYQRSTKAGEYYFDIRVYDIGERDNLEKLGRQSGLGKKFKDSFKQFQGLRVSKNGFGVKPYGEEMEDWLELSKQRVQDPGHTVNTNQILGNVFFYSPENDNLQEKTNREGFLENVAYSEVVRTLQAIFRDLGRKRYIYRLRHSLGRVPKSKHTRPNFQRFLNDIKRSDDLSHIRKYSERFMKDVNTSMDNLEESLTFSERLASLGSGIELVYHEMVQPISGLKTTIASLNLKKDNMQSEVKKYYLFDIDALGDSAEALTELRKSLQPAIGRSRKKKFRPYLTFHKVCRLFKSDLDDNHISPLADERLKDLEITDQEYAFWIAFLNIMNNAIYWIKKSGEAGVVRFHVENGSFVVSNSGPPIKEDIVDYIFEYGVTTKTEKHATGLGLSFTRSILGNIGWEIKAENRSDGPAFIIYKRGRQ